MNFLAPLFLIGGLAVLGPIAFHLIRRTTRDATPFSTLMFLRPTPPRVTKRSRFENLWLLLLRCLALALLALCFARPFLPREISAAQSAATGRRVVILVDTSASMRREDLWAQACAKVDSFVRAAQPEDDVAVLTFDRVVRPIFSFEAWQQTPLENRANAVVQRLASSAPTWAATNLATALTSAEEQLERSQKTAEIVVISDLQEGSRCAELSGYGWPREVRVRLDPVTARETANASAHWLAESEEVESGGPRLRVSNSADARVEQLALRWNPAAVAGEKIPLYVPAGQTRSARPSAPGPEGGQLALEGDAVAFDNALFILPRQQTRLPLLYLGADADEDPTGAFYFLARAFQKTPELRVVLSAFRGNAPIPAFQLTQAQLLVLGEGLSDAALPSVRAFARDGKTVLAALANTDSAAVLGRLLEVPGFSAQEAALKDYAMLAQIDFQHPLFASFADPRFSDFTKIHFWKYRRFDAAMLPGARVLARFDDQAPAIVEVPLGSGRVIIFASSWRPADSQLALSSKFVPLLFALLEQSSKLPPRKAQYFVGDDVPLPPGAQPFTIRKPDGSTESAAAGSVFSGTDQPGIYEIAPGSSRFAVNLDPGESNLTPLTEDRLAALGVPLAGRDLAARAPTAHEAAQAQAAELESRQKLWRWLLLAALAVLLLETLLPSRMTRHLQPAT